MIKTLTLAFATLTMAFVAVAADKKEEKAAAWPATKAGTLAHHWLDAFLSGEDAMRKFITNEMAPNERSIDERMASYSTNRQHLGALKLSAVTRSTPYELDATLNLGDGTPVTATFATQTVAPFKLVSVKFAMPGHGQ